MYYLVFIFICFIKLHVVLCNGNNNQSDAAVIADCAQELHIDVHKYDNGIDLNEYLENPTNEKTCMIACAMRKVFNAQGLSLYQGFIFMINDVYKKGFTTKEFNKEDVILKVERCQANEHDECKFFACVNLFGKPVFDIFVYDIVNSLTTAVIQSLFN